MNKSNHALRSAPRVHVEAFVKLRGNDHEYVFRTRDISSEGLFLYTKASHRYPIKTGDTLDIELYDYNQHILCQVSVVRVVVPDTAEASNYPCGYGVTITKISDEAKTILHDLIARVEQGDTLY